MPRTTKRETQRAAKSSYGVSVLEFGARGDGCSDDSEAIQKALDSGKELVTVPFGCYKIGKTLRINSNTRLMVHPHARRVQTSHRTMDTGPFPYQGSLG